jgi:hypothetical protein
MTQHPTPNTQHLHWLRVGWLVIVWMCASPSVLAQTGVGGWQIELYGMVQVEPGSNVLTIDVKDEEIRFAVHDVRSADRNFTLGRFLSDLKHRTPGLYIKGSESILELLLKEKPNKRALRLQGVFYPDSRMFIVNSMRPLQETTPKRDF